MSSQIDLNNIWSFVVWLLQYLLLPGVAYITGALGTFLETWINMENAFFYTMILIIVGSIAIVVKNSRRRRG